MNKWNSLIKSLRLRSIHIVSVQYNFGKTMNFITAKMKPKEGIKSRDLTLKHM